MSESSLDQLLEHDADRWVNAQKPAPDLDVLLNRVIGSARHHHARWIKPLAAGVAAAAVVTIAFITVGSHAQAPAGSSASSSSAIPQKLLVGTWLLQHVRTNDAVLDASGYRTTLAFTPDEQFQITTPCLFTSGTYADHGDSVTFHAVGSTGGCANQTNAARQAIADAVQLLGQGDQGYKISADQLVVTTPAAVSFTFVATASAPNTTGGQAPPTTN